MMIMVLVIEVLLIMVLVKEKAVLVSFGIVVMVDIIADVMVMMCW